MSLVRERPPLDFGLVSVLLRRAVKTRSFVLLLALGVSITGALTFIVHPVFRSEAGLRFRQQAATEPGALQQSERSSPLRMEMELHEMLVSRSIPETLIKEFDLYRKTTSRFGLAAAAEEMRRHDLHLLVRDDGLIRLSFDSSSPELAQAVASRGMALLVQAHTEARSGEVRDMEQFLEEEKRRVEQERRTSESKLASLQTGDSSLAEGDLARAEAIIPEAKAMHSGPSDIAAQLRKLRERQSQLREGLSRPLADPKDTGPGSSIGRDQQEERALQQQIDLLEKQARSAHPSDGRPKPRTDTPTMPSPLLEQVEGLKRKERESREHLAILENRQFRAELQSLFMSRTRSAELDVVAPATKPTEPVGLPRSVTIGLGVSASLALALVIGLLIAINDDRLREAADIRRFGLPQLLCEVPPSDSSS